MITLPGGSPRRASVALSTETDPERAAFLATAEAASEVGRHDVRTVVVFASGAHAKQTDAIAKGAARAVPKATVVVAGGADVMAPGGESDGQAAMSVLVLTDEVSVVTSNAGGEPRAMGQRMGSALASDKLEPYMLLCRSHIFDRTWVDGFYDATQTTNIIGGGISDGATLTVQRPNEEAVRCAALAVRFNGRLRLSVGVTPGVVHLTDYMTVESIDEGFVTRMSGQRPLEVLSAATAARGERSLVLVAIAPRGEGHDRGNLSLVRGVTGVHPQKGAVHLGDEVRVGDRVAFATPDSHAAKEDFRTMLRSLERGMGGGVPVAGLYMGCASRGSKLFARPGADARSIRGGLGDLPFAGMYSSFEIAPFEGRPRMHVYSGVLAMLYAPS